MKKRKDNKSGARSRHYEDLKGRIHYPGAGITPPNW
jgi:hypothetical protein